jgi:hypothetical protein
MPEGYAIFYFTITSSIGLVSGLPCWSNCADCQYVCKDLPIWCMFHHPAPKVHSLTGRVQDR